MDVLIDISEFMDMWWHHDAMIWKCYTYQKSFVRGIRHSPVQQRPVSLTFFARNSNSMENSSCCNSVAAHQIETNFCTCHDSTAVVSCTKFCSNHFIRLEMRVKRNFHRNWNAMEKPLVKWGPGPVWLTVHLSDRSYLLCTDSSFEWIHIMYDTIDRLHERMCIM